MESNGQDSRSVAKSTEDALPAYQPPRRSPRKPSCIPIWLRHEARGPIWEEETETHVLSRFGAGLHCRHSIIPDAIVTIICRDSGQSASARVRYSRYNRDGTRELGVEFIDQDNFWGLDWSADEPGQPQMEAGLTRSGSPAGDSDTDQSAEATAAEAVRELLD